MKQQGKEEKGLRKRRSEGRVEPRSVAERWSVLVHEMRRSKIPPAQLLYMKPEVQVHNM